VTDQTQKDKEMRGRVLNLAELVSYQDGSIVSRTVVDKKAGTITVFAFDEGQSLSEHTAPYDAVVEVVDGVGTITIEKDEHSLDSGQTIIMPAGVPHAVRADKRFKMVLTMIRSD